MAFLHQKHEDFAIYMRRYYKALPNLQTTNGLSIIMHVVISLQDATPYNKVDKLFHFLEVCERMNSMASSFHEPQKKQNLFLILTFL